MKKFKANKDLVIKLIFIILSITFILISVCSILFTPVWFNGWLLILIITSFVATIIFYRLALLKNKGYKLKYYFSNKKYEKEIEQSLTKFAGAPESFIDEFKRETKRTYRYSGYLFSRDTNDLVYKDKKAKEIILELYQKLYNSILSKGGFIKFFQDVESMNFESSWIMNNYMLNDLISYELEYLINKVYILTDYTVYDNGISKNFTERNNKLIKDLNEVYSPLLFNFEKEIENLLQKLNSIS